MFAASDPNLMIGGFAVGGLTLAGLWRFVAWVREAPTTPDPWDAETHPRSVKYKRARQKANSYQFMKKLSSLLLVFSVGVALNARADQTFPIATTSAIEFAFGAAFDGSNYLVAIQEGSFAIQEGYSQGSITAQLVSQSGALVGSRISTGEFGFMPLLAFDGTNYFMVWAGSGFRGQFVSKSGALVRSVLTINAVTSSDTSVAYGSGKYLACWSDSSSVSGQLVTPAGTLSGPSFTISGATQRARENAVAFDGTNFLVVFNGSGDYKTNIYGQFVSPAGGLVGSTVLIDSSADPKDNPLAVAFDGTNYLVTFNDEVGGLGGAFHIFGRLVNTSGTVLTNQITIANDPGRQHFPFSAFDGSSYLVAWNDGAPTTNSNLILRFFNRTGQPLGSEFSPFTAQGTNQPCVGIPLFDGTRFLIVGTLGNLTNGLNFASGDVYGTFIPKSTAAPQLSVASPFANGQFSLLLTGTPGINYAIQTSTNLGLTNWTALVTNSPTNGTFSFTDIYATNASRFYRALKQ